MNVFRITLETIANVPLKLNRNLNRYQKVRLIQNKTSNSKLRKMRLPRLLQTNMLNMLRLVKCQTKTTFIITTAIPRPPERLTYFTPGQQCNAQANLVTSIPFISYRLYH